ncbi:aspartate aminotransferase family protein [Streptomyces hirsutus]
MGVASVTAGRSDRAGPAFMTACLTGMQHAVKNEGSRLTLARMTAQPEPPTPGPAARPPTAPTSSTLVAQELIDRSPASPEPRGRTSGLRRPALPRLGRPATLHEPGLVFTNVGYQHPKVVAAIQEQAGRMTTFAPAFAVEARSDPADRRIGRRATWTRLLHQPGRGRRRARRPDGAAAPGRPKVLSAYRSYHGRTQQAVNLTGDPRRWASDSGTAGVALWAPFLYRSRFYAQTEEEECARALEHLETTIAFEGVDVRRLSWRPFRGGQLPPPPVLAGVPAATRTGRLVLDGPGRRTGSAGRHLFSDDCRVCRRRPSRKGVNSRLRTRFGCVAISGAMPRRSRSRPYPAGSPTPGTAGLRRGRPINAMAEEGIVENAARLGASSSGRRCELAERHPSAEVRRVGMFWALELAAEPETGSTGPAQRARARR